MYVVILNYEYEQGLSTVGEVLHRYPKLVNWAEALAEAGARVQVLQRFYREGKETRGRVTFRLVETNNSPHLGRWQIPGRLHWVAAGCASEGLVKGHPAVVQLCGLRFPVQARWLRATLPPECALVVEHEGEMPWSGLSRVVQRRCLRAVDGFLFADPDHVDLWRQATLIRPWQPVCVTEGRPGDPAHGRQVVDFYRALALRRSE